MRNRIINQTRKAYRRSAILVAILASSLVVIAVALGFLAITLTITFLALPGVVLAVAGYWLIILAMLEFGRAFTLWRWRERKWRWRERK